MHLCVTSHNGVDVARLLLLPPSPTPAHPQALGNAKTTNNNNSSRFGKYLEIIFDGAGVVSGARFKTFLLE